MIPPGHFLLVKSPVSFRARILAGDECRVQEESIRRPDGTWFTLFMPLAPPRRFLPLTLRIFAYEPDKCLRKSGDLLFLPPPDRVKTRLVFQRPTPEKSNLLFLGTNGRGGMTRASAFWGRLDSRYDALLAANLHPEVPEDRWIMLTRLRGWVVYQGYSRELKGELTERFEVLGLNQGCWRFFIPTGRGEHVVMTAAMEMKPAGNRMRIRFFREKNHRAEGCLDNEKPVRLILRPDVEDRSFHELTKAYTGPEKLFPESVKPTANGFLFSPHPDRCLRISMSSGGFTLEPEWRYMVLRQQDAERGQDGNSDLFSPGWLFADLKGGDETVLEAEILARREAEGVAWPMEEPPGATRTPAFEIMEQSLSHYVVGRGDLATVIAGYPWFLDWGRDTLIFARGPCRFR